MTMTSNEKRMLEREALRSVIQQWNANRLDLFELSEPDEVSYNNLSVYVYGGVYVCVRTALNIYASAYT